LSVGILNARIEKSGAASFSETILETTMDSWRECAWFKCRKRFEPGRRANQHHHANADTHDGALYCSNPCRQKAYRLRRRARSATVTPAPRNSGKVPKGTTHHATVTPTKIRVKFQGVRIAKIGHARPQNGLLSTRAGQIVPDAKWPNMYRIKWRDGRLSDMVNYTRASAALRGLM
jgi:hypothetical protein